jgi:hypothetical protein
VGQQEICVTPSENNRKGEGMKLIALLFIALLTGCASTPSKIVAQPAAGALPIQITSPGIVAALQADAANLDQAVAIGAIPKDDPAPACLHDFLRKAGIEVAPGAAAAASFEPDPKGKASILYIQIRQARTALNGPGVQIASSCYAILGEMHFNAIIDLARGAGGINGLLLRP